VARTRQQTGCEQSAGEMELELAQGCWRTELYGLDILVRCVPKRDRRNRARVSRIYDVWIALSRVGKNERYSQHLSAPVVASWMVCRTRDGRRERMAKWLSSFEADRLWTSKK